MENLRISPKRISRHTAPDAEAVASTTGLDRRLFLARLGMTGLGAGIAASLLAGCGSGSGNVPIAGGGTSPTPTPTPTPTGNSTPRNDADILNFALNLEYLEAEYYLRAATGTGLSSSDSGSGAGTVTGGRAVTFNTPAFQQYANEIAADELAHVRLLRSALGTAAVPRPAIDLTAAFNAAAAAAGISSSGFDPFANETNFLIGAFAFEDVGVTAYKGAAPSITTPAYLAAAAGILAVEAYHAAEIRTILFEIGGSAVTAAGALSALRAAAGNGKDQAVVLNGVENIVPTDANGLAFDRTTSEVLHIVYLAAGKAANKGGFFPNGLNGYVNLAA